MFLSVIFIAAVKEFGIIGLKVNKKIILLLVMKRSKSSAMIFMFVGDAIIGR